MAQRIYVCQFCQNQYVLKAWLVHKYDVLARKCYDLAPLHEVEFTDADEEYGD